MSEQKPWVPNPRLVGLGTCGCYKQADGTYHTCCAHLDESNETLDKHVLFPFQFVKHAMWRHGLRSPNDE